jgi:hypothetical protein
MEHVTSPLCLRWRLAIAMMASAMTLAVLPAHAQWRGRAWHGGAWHGGWGGWHGGWGWHGPGWRWGGVSVGVVAPPFYYGWPFYPPAAYYPPPAAYYPPPAYYPPAYPYGYYPNAYAPGYYGYASPPTAYSAPQAYAQQGYGTSPALDPNNCGTPDEPKPCRR